MQPEPATLTAAMVATDPGLERRNSYSVRQWLDSPCRRSTDRPTDEWFLTYYDLICSVLRRYGLRSDEVDDAAQEVMLIAVRHGFADIACPAVYFRETARHMATRFGRSRQRAHVPLSQVVETTAVTDNFQQFLWDQSMREAVRRLPDELREVYWLVEVHEHTQIEAMGVLGISRWHVQDRYARACEQVDQFMLRQGFACGWGNR